MAQWYINNLPANAGDTSLIPGLATHSRILAWEIPWTEEPGKLQSIGSQSDMTQQLNNNNIRI